MAFFSKKETATSPVDEAKRKIQDQTAQELAVADVTELVNNMTRNCFDLCVPQPGPLLTTAQTSCTDLCVKKYMKAWDLLSQTYVGRIQKT